MKRDPRAYLWEVQQAAEAILDFTRELEFTAYAQSNLIQSAVERKFEIIGEALNRLVKTDPFMVARLPDTAGAISFRNRLIHGYHNIEHDKVWRVIVADLPKLLAAVTALLDDLGPP